MLTRQINKINLTYSIKYFGTKCFYSGLTPCAFHFRLMHCNRKSSFLIHCKNIKLVNSRSFSNQITSKFHAKLNESQLDVMYKALAQEKDEFLVEAFDWQAKVLEYNLKNGKKNRGTAVVAAYEMLSNDVTKDGLRAANILGWCVEMLQAFFIVADDVMDQSTMRRGEPCWYKKPEVGLIAVNDSLLLQYGIFKVLRNCFGDSEFYNNILQEFLQSAEKTCYGQCLDMLSNPPHSKPNFEHFTYERYKAIVEYKTSWYTFCLPVHLALHLIGNKNAEEFQIATAIGLKLGLLFQAQDDFLDCFGDPTITGKKGSDIAQGKCTWLATTFLNDADEFLIEDFKENYGNEDGIAIVMGIYEHDNMRLRYNTFEKELFNETKDFIEDKLKNKKPMLELYSYFLHKMYKRNK